jgi:hypothetical protein
MVESANSASGSAINDIAWNDVAIRINKIKMNVLFLYKNIKEKRIIEDAIPFLIWIASFLRNSCDRNENITSAISSCRAKKRKHLNLKTNEKKQKIIKNIVTYLKQVFIMLAKILYPISVCVPVIPEK